ncbi:Carbon starvation protein A homolog [Alteromonas infernus]
MQSIAIVILGIIGMMFGWFVYSKFIANRIFKLDDSFVTPAHTMQDGVDFVPTNKVVLWGGTISLLLLERPPLLGLPSPFIGAGFPQCFGWSSVLSCSRVFTIWAPYGQVPGHKGKSMGALSESVIGKRSRALFMIVIFLVLLMVNAVFGVVIANSFVSQPNAVFPAWTAIVVALIIGQLLKRNFSLIPLCIVGIFVLYASVYAGSYIPLSLPETMFGLADKANWIIILFVYAAIASLLPVWMLLQPRDFINGMQLLVGLFLLYGAVFFAMPDITAPAFNMQTAVDSPSIIPLLFVTIACGAVSGFHGIVSSGTSSKQLDKETDARFVGYLGAVGEGSLALITIVAVSGVAFAASPEEWHEVYSHLGAGSVGAFITGGANLIQQGWGLPVDFSSTILAVMVVLFAGTTMDSGVRLQRYIIQEWGDIYSIKALRNGVVATLLAVGCCLLLAFGAGGASGSGGMIIWPLFGSTNQILASLTLLVISVMLIKLGRPARYTLIPMVFVLIMAFFAGLIKLKEYYVEGNYLLVFLDAVVLVVSVLVMLEAFSVVSKLKKESQNKATQE